MKPSRGWDPRIKILNTGFTYTTVLRLYNGDLCYDAADRLKARFKRNNNRGGQGRQCVSITQH